MFTPLHQRYYYMTMKNRWEQILEEFWQSSDEDTTYTTLERELAERIAELERVLNRNGIDQPWSD